VAAPGSGLGCVGEGLFELGLDEGDHEAPPRRGYGGDAANTAVMAARLGAIARLCGRVGDDALGRELLAFWRRTSVDTTSVRVDPTAPTGLYVNERLRDGGSRFHYHRRGSAGSGLAPDDVGDAFLDGLRVVHYTGVTLAVSDGAAEAAREAARRGRARSATVSLAVNHRPALGGDAFALLAAARAADVVFVSTEESETLLGTTDPGEIARALGGRTRELVVTRAGEGAVVVADSTVSAVAAPQVEVVDAAGAGDALAGAYLASRLAGHEPPSALARAVAAASLSCRAYGCALSYPDAAAVDALASS
jgi:2-dehydro-3-deoxygluconokinase